ncbi:MAG: N-acetylmuramoyl-L-alanine amidase [Clostridia bacterium]|nr:N-acetylmuramoyl-L-alanine amidase [Clostridia bacterium]
MSKVYLGIGHGGADSGAVGNDFEEKDLALAIGLACRDELQRHGITVMTSRTGGTDKTVAAKVKECNTFAPALAADIHINAGGGDGAEVYHTKNGGKGETLAANILDAIKEIGQNSRGLKTKINSSGKDYFAFIRDTAAPAVIVECAFIDNKSDLAIIDTAAEQKAFGKAIAKGFLRTLGIAYKEEETEVAKTKFKDESEIPSWALDSVKKVFDEGIMIGDDKGYFNPNENVTRAELAVALAKIAKL